MRLAALILALSPAAAHADPAVVEKVAMREGSGGWTFDVTISHPDTGWDDYADGWRVVTADGTVLGTRVLAHPHVEEQPFTRSLSGVEIPDGVAEIYIEASTNVEGWGEARVPVVLGE